MFKITENYIHIYTNIYSMVLLLSILCLKVSTAGFRFKC